MPINGDESVQMTNDTAREFGPLWHPDGRRLLYNVERNDYLQIDLAYLDGRGPVQVTRGEGSYELIDVSPDGSRIYYTSWEKRSDISSVNVETGEETEIAAGLETELWPEVSPDGKALVYQMNGSPNPTANLNESILVVKAFGGETTQVLHKGSNPHWLPDSRRFAFLRWHEAEQADQLWILNTVNGQETQVTTDGVRSPSIGLMPIARADIGEFDFSPDGGRLVYLDSKRPKNVRMISTGSSESANLTNNNSLNLLYSAPLFSPGGEEIVFVSTEKFPDKRQLPRWRVMLFQDGRSKEIFSTTSSVRLVGWSPSGKDVFVETTDGPMKIGPLDVNIVQISLTGKSKAVASLQDVHADTMTLAVDGATVAFVARRSDKDDVWIMSLDSGRNRKITNNGNTRIFFASLAWSPDSKTIYFDSQEQINTISMFENFK